MEMDCIVTNFVIELPVTHKKLDTIWVIVDRLDKSADFILINQRYSLG